MFNFHFRFFCFIIWQWIIVIDVNILFCRFKKAEFYHINQWVLNQEFSRWRSCARTNRARTHTARAGIRARAIVVINNIKNWLKSNTESHGRIQKENYVKFPFSKILNLMWHRSILAAPATACMYLLCTPIYYVEDEDGFWLLDHICNSKNHWDMFVWSSYKTNTFKVGDGLIFGYVSGRKPIKRFKSTFCELWYIF